MGASRRGLLSEATFPPKCLTVSTWLRIGLPPIGPPRATPRAAGEDSLGCSMSSRPLLAGKAPGSHVSYEEHRSDSVSPQAFEQLASETGGRVKANPATNPSRISTATHFVWIRSSVRSAQRYCPIFPFGPLCTASSNASRPFSKMMGEGGQPRMCRSTGTTAETPPTHA